MSGTRRDHTTRPLLSVDCVKEIYASITRVLIVYLSSLLRNGLHSRAAQRRALTWTRGI